MATIPRDESSSLMRAREALVAGRVSRAEGRTRNLIAPRAFGSSMTASYLSARYENRGVVARRTGNARCGPESRYWPKRERCEGHARAGEP